MDIWISLVALLIVVGGDVASDVDGNRGVAGHGDGVCGTSQHERRLAAALVSLSRKQAICGQD